MGAVNISELVVRVWKEELDETPDIWAGDLLYDLLTGERLLYRDYLDRQPINWEGKLIPRIMTVRRNLRRLGNIRLNPARLVPLLLLCLLSSGCSLISFSHCAQWNILPALGIPYFPPVCAGGIAPATYRPTLPSGM